MTAAGLAATVPASAQATKDPAVKAKPVKDQRPAKDLPGAPSAPPAAVTPQVPVGDFSNPPPPLDQLAIKRPDVAPRPVDLARTIVEESQTTATKKVLDGMQSMIGPRLGGGGGRTHAKVAAAVPNTAVLVLTMFDDDDDSVCKEQHLEHLRQLHVAEGAAAIVRAGEARLGREGDRKHRQAPDEAARPSSWSMKCGWSPLATHRRTDAAVLADDMCRCTTTADLVGADGPGGAPGAARRMLAQAVRSPCATTGTT